MSIDINVLKGKIPDVVYDQLFDACTFFKIQTPLRLAHFLAQCSHESAGFARVEENLNYSAKRLLQVFPKYFTEESAIKYEHNGIMIASRVYADRIGNRDETSQDGWKFRGRGYIQLTGKENYEKFGSKVSENLLTDPDLVATKYPLLSAAWFWDSKNLNEIADAGATENEVAAITRKVNGGFNGLEERTKLFHKFNELLNG